MSGKIGGVTATSTSSVVVGGGVLTPGELQIHANVREKTFFYIFKTYFS